ncbi:hypothetical protein ACFVZW_15665 [Streptomyces sp. NPDC059567]|uniref:hypothetical protein n=1 Tax=Streptomyces sp. NPDC059567 TaxID=3346867 RepID=UPI0036C0DACC
MAISRVRKVLMLGTSGVVVAWFGAVALTTGAQAAPQTMATAEVATEMPVAVENFSYPDAERILQERRITLKRGDGHITLVPCSQTWDIKVESRFDINGYCFKVTSDTGFLTLELPDVWGVWTKSNPIEATLTAEGEETVLDLPANKYQAVGETGDSGLRSVLVEMRITG